MSGLSASNVTVRFGGHVALDGVSIDAPVGRITGLIGPNGAGKTTMFNVCSGYQRPDRGSVVLEDRDITGDSASARARAGLGRTFQRMQLFGSLTVRENIELASDAQHIGDDPLSMLGLRGGGHRRRAAVRDQAEGLLELVGLTGVADHRANALATGQGRLLELARALAREPRILLLDEPSSGLDGIETTRFGAILTDVVSNRDVGILLVEHDMSLVLDVCEHLFVLDFGRALFAGTADDIRSSDEVRAAYLGRDASDGPARHAPADEPGHRVRRSPLRASSGTARTPSEAPS